MFVDDYPVHSEEITCPNDRSKVVWVADLVEVNESRPAGLLRNDLEVVCRFYLDEVQRAALENHVLVVRVLSIFI